MDIKHILKYIKIYKNRYRSIKIDSKVIQERVLKYKILY
jgi:hypothetical protein